MAAERRLLATASSWPRVRANKQQIPRPGETPLPKTLHTRLRQLAATLNTFEPAILIGLLPIFLLADRYLWLGVAILVAVWTVRWLTTGRFTRLCPTLWPLVLLAVLIPVTLAITALPAITRAQVGYLVAGLAFYLGVINWTTSQTRLVWLLGGVLVGVGLLAAASPVVVEALAKELGHSFGPITALSQRMPEHVNPNVMSGALALWTPIALFLAWRPLGANKQQRWLLRIVASASAVALTLALYLLRTRGVWLALSVALVLVALVRWPRFWRLLPLLVTGLWLAVMQGWYARFIAAIFRDDPVGGLDVRYDIWARALLALREFSITGLGMGGWAQLSPLLYPSSMTSPLSTIEHAHNLIIQIGVDLGVPGLIAYLALLGLSFGLATRARRRFLAAANYPAANLSLAVWAALAAMLIHGLVDAVTWGTKPAVLAWVLLALCAVLYLHAEKAKTGIDIATSHTP